jgi:hypothetical protein
MRRERERERERTVYWLQHFSCQKEGILLGKLLGDYEGWRGIQQAKRCTGLLCYQMGYGPEVVNTNVVAWKEIIEM